MHTLIPSICTYLLNYQFDKVIFFFLNYLLFYGVPEISSTLTDSISNWCQ